MPIEVDVKNDQGVLAIDKLSEEQKNKVLSIKRGISFTDSQAVVQFGVGAQGKIAEFSDTILSEIRNKDSGFVGNSLSDMLVTIKDIDVGSLGNKSPFASIPIIGNIVDAARKFIIRYEKLSVQIERIVSELEKARMQLLKDITMLDKLYDKNWDYLRELDFYILAGKMAIEELQTKVIPEQQEKAKTSSDAMEAQKLQDLLQFSNRFDKKVHDLLLSRMVSIQTAPQIRLIQNNNQLLVEKIQSSILTTIPLWKSQIVIAISLFRQKKALALQKEVTDTTNDLLLKNSELLKQTSVDIARQSERGIVDIETLKKVNEDLIATIEETLMIQNEGSSKRRAAEDELKKLEQELKAKLIEIKGK